MAEYIEREALYQFLTEQLDKETGAYSKGRNAGIHVARSALHNREITPAADVAPVVYGRWIDREGPDEDGNVDEWCSRCMHITYASTGEKHKDTIYIADGWFRAGESKSSGKGWENRPGRSNRDTSIKLKFMRTP